MRMALLRRSIALLLGLFVLLPVEGEVCSPEDQMWSGLAVGTVKSLQWETCYGTRLCAKLQVPLDYAEPNGPQAVLALLKVPASIPQSDENYKGPIIFNPGGPGGSVVDYINIHGDQMQAVFGTEYDILGFDPRGVGRTMPLATVFQTAGENLVWQLQTSDGPLPFETTDAVARLYDSSYVYGDLVFRKGQSYAPYVSTALVARDMLEVTRAHGREKLLYWGISYGSMVGMTYAAMLPNNVERMIIDGVIDAEDYLSGAQAVSLIGTDASLRAFYQACVDAGPSKCPIYESSTDKVAKRVDTIINGLKRRPVSVFVNETGDTGTYGLVTYKIAKTLLFNFLFMPYLGPPDATTFSNALRALEQGDGSLFWKLSGPSRTSLTCNGTTFPLPPITFSISEAGRANLCTDTDPIDGTVEELEAYFEEQREISQFADVWPIAPPCRGWKVRPVERFRGPFETNTSFPLLFVSNMHDPVLPVQNAIKMSKGFTDSVVLFQNSSGHCSIAAESTCTAKVMRDYMRDGILPVSGTVCEIESKYFGDAVPGDNLTCGDPQLESMGDKTCPANQLGLV